MINGLYRFGILVFPLIFKLSVSAKGIDDAKRLCLSDGAKAKRSCDVVYHEKYTMNVFSEAYSMTLNGISPAVISLIDSTDSILNEYIFENEKKNIEKSKNKKKAKAIKNELLSHMKKKISKSQLNQCQVACLGKCVTSEMMTYKMNRAKPKVDGPENHYLTQKGVCTEFAELATDISQSLGLEVRTTYNMAKRHAYNEFFIDDQWVYFEPQSPSCEFFESSLDQHKINEARSQKVAINDDSRMLNFRKSKVITHKKIDFSKSLQK
ncbi:transglutaminase-like domain-containing protein [Bacteriovorax sp. DB6_IX]|uniref:transglutaminase-like domain-containing protein n=1 Tax=Bacteriovorax sp. DB6_IX TaxID=1353530 RepID=UPI00038A2C44|nr:transglutaminase-like domain-containing protein [Bacteriovorax sp. DB6_IX]EQC50454.1 transglutaminase-like protein [Bacteriovorax sp. DB6_IX]